MRFRCYNVEDLISFGAGDALENSWHKIIHLYICEIGSLEIPDAFEVHKAPQYTVNISRNSKHRKFD